MKMRSEEEIRAKIVEQEGCLCCYSDIMPELSKRQILGTVIALRWVLGPQDQEER